MAPVPASAHNVWDRSLFATKLSISNVVSYQANRALLHSPVIAGLTNLTKLSFHCGGGGGGWCLAVVDPSHPVLPQADG